MTGSEYGHMREFFKTFLLNLLNYQNLFFKIFFLIFKKFLKYIDATHKLIIFWAKTVFRRVENTKIG